MYRSVHTTSLHGGRGHVQSLVGGVLRDQDVDVGRRTKVVQRTCLDDDVPVDFKTSLWIKSSTGKH